MCQKRKKTTTQKRKAAGDGMMKFPHQLCICIRDAINFDSAILGAIDNSLWGKWTALRHSMEEKNDHTNTKLL